MPHDHRPKAGRKTASQPQVHMVTSLADFDSVVGRQGPFPIRFYRERDRLTAHAKSGDQLKSTLEQMFDQEPTRVQVTVPNL